MDEDYKLIVNVPVDHPGASKTFYASSSKNYHISLDDYDLRHIQVQIQWTLVHLAS